MDAAERLNRRLAVTGLGLALVTALAVHAYLTGLARRAARPTTTPVLVAARAIPAHSLLTAAMLQVAPFTPATAPPGALTNLGQAVGGITVAPLYPGQPLVQADLSGTRRPASLSFAVAPGQRAITIAVGATNGVGEMIVPGDHVDVLVTFTSGTATTVDTLAQDVLVLAVGQRIAGQGGAVPTNYSTVTLQVSPAAAQQVAFAESRGQLTLTLRSVTDQASVALPAETGAELTGG